MITCPLVDGPSGRFAQAASQTNDDGIDTNPPAEIRHQSGFTQQLVEAQKIMASGSRGPALQDSRGKRQERIFLPEADRHLHEIECVHLLPAASPDHLFTCLGAATGSVS